MSNIYRDGQPVPIPSDAVPFKDGRVFLEPIPGNPSIKIDIGRLSDDQPGFMYPNDNFRDLYPKVWNKGRGKKADSVLVMKFGLFAACFAASEQYGVGAALKAIFNSETCDALFDFAQFCIESRKNKAMLFKDFMARNALFSNKLLDDKYFSNLFKNEIDQQNIDEFQAYWPKVCVEKIGVKRAWICIDGSNNNCVVKDSSKTEPGHAKSGSKKPIISYIWAVDADTGMPLTWNVNPGAMLDFKALDKIILTLKASGIEVAGVIVDRGFATQKAIDFLKAQGMDFVMMLKGDSNGHQVLYARHAEAIRLKVDYMIDNDAYGTTDQAKVFQVSSDTTCIGLIYKPKKAARACEELNQLINDTVETLRDEIAVGKKKLTAIPSEIKKIVLLQSDKDGQRNVVVDKQAWQDAIDRKGFIALASNKTRGAGEIYKLYKLRDVSEKQYSLFKSHLGFNATNVHNDESLQSKFLAGFVAAILNTIFLNVCKKIGASRPKLVNSFQSVEAYRVTPAVYYLIDNMNDKQQKFFAELGLNQHQLTTLAVMVGDRRLHADSAVSPITMPAKEKTAKRPVGRPPKCKEEKKPEAKKTAPKKRGGRRAGSKNKKTLEREALLLSMPVQNNRGPGRPKGSLNKSTEEKLARQARANSGPGRPKGSQNKDKLEEQAREQRALRRLRLKMQREGRLPIAGAGTTPTEKPEEQSTTTTAEATSVETTEQKPTSKSRTQGGKTAVRKTKRKDK